MKHPIIKFGMTVILIIYGIHSQANHPIDEDLPSRTAEHGRHIDIDLQVSEQPALGKAVKVDAVIKNNLHPLRQLSIELDVPDGLQLTQNLQNKSFTSFASEFVISESFMFAATETGNHKVTVKVTAMTDNDKLIDSYEYLYFNVDEDPGNNQMGWDKTKQDEGDPWTPSEKVEMPVDDEGYVTIPAADENQNETTRKVLASEYFSENQVSGGTVTINGRYQFRNRENNANIGYYHNYLQLINSSTNEVLAVTYTDNDGNFTFPAATNPGADGMRVRVYAVRFLSGGKGYGACEYPSCIDQAASSSTNIDQFHYRQSLEFTTPNGNQNIGTYTSGYNLTNNLRALWIKHDMDVAYQHLLQNSNIRGPFTAEWATDSTHGNHYHGGANIHFKADVGDGTNSIILHELGHNVMYNADSFPNFTDCPSPHYTNKVSGTICAWTEGWASTFATFVNDSPTYCYPPSTSNCTDFETDPSYDNCANGWDCGFDSDQVEGHVTGALWDMYDHSEDGFDIETFDIEDIYFMFELEPHSSFMSWVTNWIVYGGHSELTYNSLFQNDIVYGDIYDVRVIQPNVNNNAPETGESINVSASIRNLGEISSVNTNIDFYLSTNQTISPFDQLMGTHYRGILDPNVSAITAKSFAVNSAGNYWVGACFNDIDGFDTNSNNDCTEGVPITVTADDLIFATGFE